MARATWTFALMAFACFVHSICSVPVRSFNEIEDLLERLRMEQKLEGAIRNSQLQSNMVNNPLNDEPHPEEVYRVHRTSTPLDNLGSGFLLKRNSGPIDTLGGGILLGKRRSFPIDTLGGGILLRKSGTGNQQLESPRASVLDSLGSGYLL